MQEFLLGMNGQSEADCYKTCMICTIVHVALLYKREAGFGNNFKKLEPEMKPENPCIGT